VGLRKKLQIIFIYFEKNPKVPNQAAVNQDKQQSLYYRQVCS